MNHQMYGGLSEAKLAVEQIGHFTYCSKNLHKCSKCRLEECKMEHTCKHLEHLYKQRRETL